MMVIEMRGQEILNGDWVLVNEVWYQVTSVYDQMVYVEGKDVPFQASQVDFAHA
jgi:hypothetical protein